MGEIVDHAAEYETVHRLSEMLKATKEDYKATESYALFATIVCWVMQRARTPANQNDHADAQARKVGRELRGIHISCEPWSVTSIPDMTAFDFFLAVRHAIAHGDGRGIRPFNEGGFLVGQLVTIPGHEVRFRRADFRRLGCALADLFCATMATNGRDRNLGLAHIEKSEEPA